MDLPSTPETGSKQHVVIEPTTGWSPLRIGEIWSFRELLQFLIWRDVKVRYRQTAFGLIWVVLQPLGLMVVISVFFGLVLDPPDLGVPYPLLVLTALVPWMLFAQALAGAANSLLLNADLIAKIYFPRLLLPLAAASSYLLDFAVGMGLLVVMLLVLGGDPSAAILLLPAFLVLCLLTALGVGMILSAVSVRYRDVAAALPLVTQIWLFASPIVYTIDVVPEHLRTLYGLNPLATALTGFRWALLGTTAPPPGMVAVSVAVVGALLVVAIGYFRRAEPTFADVI